MRRLGVEFSQTASTHSYLRITDHHRYHVPVGMTLISSVNLTPEVGAELRKCDEFGYCLVGGSDVVLLFQDRNVVLEAQVGERDL